MYIEILNYILMIFNQRQFCFYIANEKIIDMIFYIQCYCSISACISQQKLLSSYFLFYKQAVFSHFLELFFWRKILFTYFCNPVCRNGTTVERWVTSFSSHSSFSQKVYNFGWFHRFAFGYHRVRLELSPAEACTFFKSASAFGA